MTPNTFTYRHSEMPPMTDEIKSEIAAIDFNAANLILKYQGHYRALSELAETLSDCLDSCEMDLYSIRIIPDGDDEVEKAIGLTDLSISDKQLIMSTCIMSTVAIKVLASIFNCDFEQAAFRVRTVGQAEFEDMSPEAVEKAIEQLAKIVGENPDKGFIRIEV